MKRYTSFGIVALFLCGLSLCASAQPAADQPPANPPAAQPDGAKKLRRNKAAQPARKKDPAKEIGAVEAMMGAPLTDVQKTQLRDAIEAREEAIHQARQAYETQLSQITGLTQTQLRAKKREANKRKRAEAANNQ